MGKRRKASPGSRNSNGEKAFRMPAKYTFLLVLILFSAALFIRIAYINRTEIDNPLRADAREYVIYGHNLAYERTFSMAFNSDNPTPDAYRSPGFPLLIALAFLLGGEQNVYLAVLYTHTVLSSLMVTLVFIVGIQFLSYWWAIAAAVLVAFSPHLVSMTSYFLTETLFSFFLLAAITFFYLALKRRSVLLFIAAGMLFGCAYLTNETALFIPFIFGFTLLLDNGFSIKKIRHCRLLLGMVFFLLVFSLFPVGWKIRNRIDLPPGALRGTNRALMAMTHGTYPGFVYKDPRWIYYPYRDDPQSAEYSSSIGNFVKIFWPRFKKKPVRHLVWYFFEKPYYFWSWNMLDGQGDVYVYPVKTSLYQTSGIANLTKTIMRILHPVIMILNLLGIPLFYFHSRKKNMSKTAQNPIYIVVIILYFTVIYSVLFPLPRYAIPLRPEMYLWALFTVTVLRDYVPGKHAPASSVASKRASRGIR